MTAALTSSLGRASGRSPSLDRLPKVRSYLLHAPTRGPARSGSRPARRVAAARVMNNATESLLLALLAAGGVCRLWAPRAGLHPRCLQSRLDFAPDARTRPFTLAVPLLTGSFSGSAPRAVVAARPRAGIENEASRSRRIARPFAAPQRSGSCGRALARGLSGGGLLVRASGTRAT